MSETQKREICEWSMFLYRDECEHCDPDTTPVLDEPIVVAFDGSRDGAIVIWPLPKEIRPEGEQLRPKAHTPRWNPGNVAAQIGDDLTLIEGMFAALGEEAEARHGDAEFPGGDALVAMGPGADVEAFGYMQISAMVGRISEDDVVLPTKKDLEPPLAFLHGWTVIIREERDQPTYLRANLAQEIKYIRDSIDWMFSLDEHGDMRFLQVDDLAAGLNNVRRRLEGILKDGTRAEFTRVHCIAEKCESHPRLMKLYTAQVQWDRYRCPDCRTDYDRASFLMAQSENLYSAGTERFMTAREAATSTGAPIKTVYSWIQRGNVKSQMAENGKPLVWWPDARERGKERKARLVLEKAKRKAIKAEKAAEAQAKAERAAAEQETAAVTTEPDEAAVQTLREIFTNDHDHRETA